MDTRVTHLTGEEALIALVERAVSQEDVEKIVDDLRNGLCSLIRNDTVKLSPHLRECCSDHYARRLVHKDDEKGYSIIAMTWGRGQATPLHDHGGMWCVEGVWEGSIDVQQYELLEEKGDEYRFEKRNSFQAGRGSAGCLIPPHEYHRISNPGDETAVSIHIYGGNMTRCAVFEPLHDGWYRRKEKQLGLDL